MSDSMVERVAMAINAGGMAWLNENDPKRMSLSWADVPDEVFARAAIEAMKEPTEAMKKTGEDAMPDGLRWSPEYGDAIDEYDPLPVWRAMISKAMEG